MVDPGRRRAAWSVPGFDDVTHRVVRLAEPLYLDRDHPRTFTPPSDPKRQLSSS